MDLLKNKYIKKGLAKRLADDNWTMERLATAQVSMLVKYPGVGQVTARNIIDKARYLITQEKLKDATLPIVGQVETVSIDPQMSARVKRIKELNENSS